MSETEIMSWHCYPSIYALGHVYLKPLLDNDVLVEEKVDGSQFSFGRFGNDLRVRSKGKEIFLEVPEKMFLKAIEYVVSIKDLLTEGWTYRCEYLMKPKHNALAYDRAPKNNLILFDINNGHESYLSYEAKQIEAERIGLETVPKLFYGKLESFETFSGFLDLISCLGSQKIEGVVVKNYYQFGKDKKVLMGKFVSEAFKEVHGREWKVGNPGHNDIIESIVLRHRTPARWEKAIQHLRDAGKLEGSPRDIGPLIKEVQCDTMAECEKEIIEELTKWAMPKIQRQLSSGLPEWYKKKLAFEQFSDVPLKLSDIVEITISQESKMDLRVADLAQETPLA